MLSVHGTYTQSIDFCFVLFYLFVFLFLHLTPWCYVDVASKGVILGNIFSRTMPKENGWQTSYLKKNKKKLFLTPKGSPMISTLLTFVLPSPTQNNAGYGLLLTPCFYGTSCKFRHRDELFTDSSTGSATLTWVSSELKDSPSSATFV